MDQFKMEIKKEKYDLSHLLAQHLKTNDLVLTVVKMYLGSEYFDFDEKSYFSRIPLWKKIVLLAVNLNAALMTMFQIISLVKREDGILNSLIQGKNIRKNLL